MSRAIIPMFLCLAASLPVAAQVVASTRIVMDPPGVRYSVDGQIYAQSAEFLWPAGSKHIVAMLGGTQTITGTTNYCGDPGSSTVIQYDELCKARYTLTGWQNSLGPLPAGLSPVQTITADPSVTFYKATFKAEYQINVAFANTPNTTPDTVCLENGQLGPKPVGAGAGVVIFNNQCLGSSTSFWLAPGEYPVQAIPYDGFVFTGWLVDSGVASSSFTNIKIIGPSTVSPRFEPAKKVRVYTNPYGLQARIDNTVVPTINPNAFVLTYPIPGYFDWAAHSTHTLGVPSPQVDVDGRTWVFQSWSNGGGQEMKYTVDEATNVGVTFTAKFVRGAHASFLTEPAGLRVRVDGTDVLSSYNVVWGVGSSYSVVAPSEQTDAQGRRYVFREWSNGSTAPLLQVTVPEGAIATGLRYVAKYDVLPQVTIQTSAPGVPIRVDGEECSTPCRIDRNPGTSVRVSVPKVVSISPSSRLEFTGWQDGGSEERVVVFDRNAQTLVGTYRTANRLSVVVEPAEAGDLLIAPAAADSFYTTDQSVVITAQARTGYRFRRWQGAASGKSESITLEMSQPRTVTAVFERMKGQGSLAIRNAAGETPVKGLAPGSIISIFGEELAQNVVVGPSAPLAQALGGVSVTVGDRILPLIYVSPEQINALLPSDLEVREGYIISVKRAGLVDATGTLDVVQTAPGLFSTGSDPADQAVAIHEDGSPVTSVRPVTPGELLTLYGTGFGLYDQPFVDGFPVPVSPKYSTRAAVEVFVGENPVKPEWSRAVAGTSGTTAIQLRIPADLKTGTVKVKAAANGQESNAVALPIR